MPTPTSLHFFEIGLYADNLLVSTGGTSPLPPDDGFDLVTAQVHADSSIAGLPIEIVLMAFGGNAVEDPDGSQGQVFFDDVQLNMPEPGFLPPFAVGVVFLSGLSAARGRVRA